MSKFCGMCGAKREQEDKFCSRCGAKFDGEIKEIQSEDSRKVLTYNIIRKEMDAKIQQSDYFFSLLGMVIGAVMALFGVLSGVGFVLLGLIGAVFTYCKHRGYRSDKFHIEEQRCVKKTHSIDPEEYGLEFSNGRGYRKVFLEVSEWECNETEIGEEFYLVFQGRKRMPCLHYSKKYWILRNE